MKTKKELNALKEEVKSVNEEMRELTDEELAQVSGGIDLPGSGGLAPVIIGDLGHKPDRVVPGAERYPVLIYIK